MNFNIFLHIISVFFILQVSTYLLSYVQTVRNIISFAFLALCMSFGLGLTYGIHYYPIFLMLTYVGAIIVATLFVVLTFDIRAEYKQKSSHVNHFWSVVIVSNIIDGFFIFSWAILRRVVPYSSTIGPSSVSEEDLRAAFERCSTNHPDLVDLCREHFISSKNRSLYNNILDYTNDLNVVSSHFYTTYSFLFICLAILLSIALMSALAILKHR